MIGLFPKLPGEVEPEKRPSTGLYRLRPTSFAMSLFLHAGLVVALAGIGPGFSVERSSRPVYDKEIKPHASKIVWYHVQKGLPEIVPEKPIGHTKEPRGAVRSRDVMIADSKVTDSKVFIWTPSPQLIQQEVKVPNLMAMTAPAPAPPPKKFMQPPRKVPVQPKPAPVELLAPPDLELAAHVEAAPALRMLQKRNFVPPPPSVVQPRLPLPQPAVLEGEPLNLASAAPAQPVPLSLGVANVPAPSFSVPGRPGSGTGTGAGANAAPPGRNADVNAVIIGLNPADRFNGSVPQGRRGAQFSTAPATGAAGTGDMASGGSIPDLATRGKAGATMSGKPLNDTAATPKGKTVLYRESTLAPIPSTLSVPLRPSSRMIPRALEARFQKRFVYTIVIPAPNLPEYSGDWILWFAERQQASADVVRMHAPIPDRKIEPVTNAALNQASEVRIQIVVIIDENGHIEPVAGASGAMSPSLQAAIDDLNKWQFKPATRNGTPVAVEGVLEIPFRLNTAIARQ